MRNTEENFGVGAKENEGDYLVFEDQFGAASYVSCKKLLMLLQKMKRKLQFAFIASCHSKLVGEVFLQVSC